MRVLRRLLLGATAASMLACTGNVVVPGGGRSDPSSGPGPQAPIDDPNPGSGSDDPETPNPDPGPNPEPGPNPNPTPEPNPNSFAFTCNPSASVTPSATTRRLTSSQYRAALGQLLQQQLGANAASVLAAVSDDLERAPKDLPSTLQGYRRMSQGLDQARVEAWYRIGETIAAEITSDSGLLSAATGGCSDAPTRACVSAFVEDWGQAAFRRPLEPSEVGFFVDTVFDLARPSVAGWRDLVITFLNSPDFLYVLESGGSGSARPLGALELAQRLSLHFWGSGPDDALMQAALSGSLDDPDAYAQQVHRLATDARARAAFDEFVTDWLQLWRRPDPSAVSDRADFVAYAGADLPSPTLLDEAKQEILDLVHYFTFVEPSSIDVLMTTRAGFARSPGLARLYGVEGTWRPGQPPLQLPPERAGLMTRVGMLLNDQATTRPILRGAAVRKRLLCDQLGLPENMDDLRLTEASDDQTTREAIEALTMQEGGGCSGCHQLLNPPGFVLEAFDGLGRYRTAEAVFAADGGLVAEHPLDLEVELLVDGQENRISGPEEMARALADSHQLRACFARQYVRFTFGREEVTATDGCVLEDLRTRLEAGETLLDVFEAVAFTDAFRMNLKP